MKTVQIHEITFESSKESFESKKYPNEGLFIVEDLEINLTDVRFVNKENNYVLGIAPDNLFLRACEIKISNVTIDQGINTDSELKPILTSGIDSNFILEFTKLLLNRK